MNKYLYKITAAFFVLMSMSSCSDYLDVTPQDKILEAETYRTESGIQNAHNGLYIQLASNELYGRQLTMDAIEILGQQYNMPSTHSKNKMAIYAYAEEGPKKTFAAIWEKAYVTILNANKFVESINEHKDVISDKKTNILKGEAIAIRAMLHFDMLRLFGPIYKTNPTSAAIPYYDAPVTANNPILSAKDVIDKVLADLDLAISLLANDPVLTVGRIDGASEFDANPYYANRGLRMNYMAVKCLKARVLLYAGDKIAASTVANEVIDFSKSNTFFPWTPYLIATDAINPDRIFSSENFFALSETKLYDTQKQLFDSSLVNDDIYAPWPARIDVVFEANFNDPRNGTNWKVPQTGGKTYKTFFKYEDVDSQKSWRFQVPMFKLSEMYLIAAETAVTPAIGFGFLNVVRPKRGLNNLATTGTAGTLTLEITKEYKKDFIGEGQLFYYYKRINSATVNNGSTTTGTIPMGPLQYVVPLPDSEINFQ